MVLFKTPLNVYDQTPDPRQCCKQLTWKTSIQEFMQLWKQVEGLCGESDEFFIHLPLRREHTEMKTKFIR